jgi:hypothetical protein
LRLIYGQTEVLQAEVGGLIVNKYEFWRETAAISSFAKQALVAEGFTLQH